VSRTRGANTSSLCPAEGQIRVFKFVTGGDSARAFTCSPRLSSRRNSQHRTSGAFSLFFSLLLSLSLCFSFSLCRTTYFSEWHRKARQSGHRREKKSERNERAVSSGIKVTCFRMRCTFPSTIADRVINYTSFIARKWERQRDRGRDRGRDRDRDRKQELVSLTFSKLSRRRRCKLMQLAIKLLVAYAALIATPRLRGRSFARV